MNNNGIPVQDFINLSRSLFDKDQIKGLIWFIVKYNIVYVHRNPWIKNLKLSPGNIIRKTKADDPKHTKIASHLFKNVMLMRDTKAKRTYMTFHSDLCGNQILDTVCNWLEFKMYLAELDLMMEIYEGDQFAFLTKDAKSLVVIYKVLDDMPCLQNEFIRYHDPKHGIEKRYIFTPNAVPADRTTVNIGGRSYNHIPLINTIYNRYPMMCI